MVVNDTCTIVSNVLIAPRCYRLTVRSGHISQICCPGQFAQIRVSESYDPLLRRPISFFNFEKGIVEFVYRVVGYGTEILSKKRPGETLEILGPLGRGFSVEVLPAGKVFVVGGGMGMIPLYPLIKLLQKRNTDFEVLMGARCEEELVLKDHMAGLYDRVRIATDDGSSGEPGFVTAILERRILEEGRAGLIYSCGPKPMLAAVSAIAGKHRIPCQVSLEERMACGLGACIGCVVMTNDGVYRKVCKDGPVFDSAEILWVE